MRLPKSVVGKIRAGAGVLKTWPVSWETILFGSVDETPQIDRPQPPRKPERPAPVSGYVQTKDVAKLVRWELKASWPETRFSVRTMAGASIRVSWEGGPSDEEVLRQVSNYAGGRGTYRGQTVLYQASSISLKRNPGKAAEVSNG